MQFEWTLMDDSSNKNHSQNQKVVKLMMIIIFKKISRNTNTE
jgi:hypothetical protein